MSSFGSYSATNFTFKADLGVIIDTIIIKDEIFCDMKYMLNKTSIQLNIYSTSTRI